MSVKKDCCKKYKVIRVPRNNCHTCWDMYFKQNIGRYLGLKQGIKAVGREKVMTVVGEKMVKQVERFQSEND